MEHSKVDKRQTSIRVAADVALFISIFIAPFWLTAILAVLAVFFFARFYEIIFLGVLIDALYLPDFSRLIIVPMTLSASAVYFAISLIKPRLRVFI